MWHLAILNLFNAASITGNVVPNSGGGTGVSLALANGDIDVAVFSPVDCCLRSTLTRSSPSFL